MSETKAHLPPPRHPLFDHHANPLTALDLLNSTNSTLKELEELIQYWKDYLPFLIAGPSLRRRYMLVRTIFYLDLLAKGK